MIAVEKGKGAVVDNRAHEAEVHALLDRLRDLCKGHSIPLVAAVEIAPGDMITVGCMPSGAAYRMRYLGEVMLHGVPGVERSNDGGAAS